MLTTRKYLNTSKFDGPFSDGPVMFWAHLVMVPLAIYENKTKNKHYAQDISLSYHTKSEYPKWALSKYSTTLLSREGHSACSMYSRPRRPLVWC